LSPNCERRASSTVAPQALLLLNHSFVQQQAALLAARAEQEAAAAGQPGPAARIRRVWQLALGRHPSPTELAHSLAFLAAEQEAVDRPPAAEGGGNPTAPATKQPMPASGPKPLLPLSRLCHGLVGSNAFLYVE